MTDRIGLGNATVTRVLEWEFDVGTGLFAETPAQAWQDDAGLLVPTCPHARYLMPEADYRFFAPNRPGVTNGARIVMQDSVIPVADQMEPWSEHLRSARRRGFDPRRDTRRGPRCRGSMQADPPCSSAT